MLARPTPSAPTVDQLLGSGRAQMQAGRTGDAAATFRAILRADPHHVEAMAALGNLVLTSGSVVEATTLYQGFAAANPRDLAAHLTLGSLLQVQRAWDGAHSVYVRVIQFAPACDEAYFRLGHVERARGNADAAIGWFRRALETRPGFWEARSNLGLLLLETGQPADAVAQLQQAAAADADQADIHFNLGAALGLLKRFDEAAAAYRRALVLRPAFPDAWNNLGGALKFLGRLDEAVAAFAEAGRLAPQWAQVHSNLAGVFEWQALHDDAVAAHRRAMALAPADAVAGSNYLFTLLFHPDVDNHALRREHATWNERFARSLPPLPATRDRDRSPDRRLRIGYVCGSFRDHALGRYLLPLLREHDQNGFEIYCYSNNRSDDAMTDRFRQLAATWRDVATLSDDETAARIRADRIDILVDTTLHMDGNRLLVFARKPAPLQMTLGGYPGTTGMPAIDYRLTDPHLDPPGVEATPYAEPHSASADTFWCYDAEAESPAVNVLPAETTGVITFGCLNNFAKTNRRVLELWARVLAKVQDARLVLLCHEGSVREQTLRLLAERGVAGERIEFVGLQTRMQYLETFHRIDVSLDTFPYNGHTTTLDSLWMGVPVVTLVGNTIVGRAGLSQLTNLRLPDLIGRNADEYVAIAAALAADRPRLAQLRRTLRVRMTESPLTDARHFAAQIESNYRAMWQRWCAMTADA